MFLGSNAFIFAVFSDRSYYVFKKHMETLCNNGRMRVNVCEKIAVNPNKTSSKIITLSLIFT